VARKYSSEVRTAQAQRTTEHVLGAAHDLFVVDGWVATTMAAVADRAGVSRQTVYMLFESKLTLLDRCIDQRLRGDHDEMPVRAQPSYQRMGQGDQRQRVAASASWLRAAHERSASIQRVLDEAAVTDRLAAVRLAERERRRWDEVRWAASLVLDTDAPDPTLVDELWTLASRDVWLKLVTGRGWTPQRWERWFAAIVLATVNRAFADDRPGRPRAEPTRSG
jgi:AcrR family transcriptional regulator